jgi:hypothetical protein
MIFNILINQITAVARLQNPFALSLSEGERILRPHPMGECRKSRSCFDRLSTNGYFCVPTAFFRLYIFKAARATGKRCGVFTLVLLGLLFTLAGPAYAAVITATPDRDPAHLDEPFTLVFSSNEGVDDDPDFSPLKKDFDILGQNQSSQISIVNGKMSNKKEWTLTLSPKRAGTIPIPPVAFGKDRSLALNITVKEAESAAPAPGEREGSVMLKVEVEPKDPYVQAQVILSVRLWIPENLRVGGNLNDPQVENALIERLFEGNGRSYATTRGGQAYTVVERKYALFPQKSGLLRIEPLRLDGEVETGPRSFFSRPTQPLRIKSEACDLKVRPIPAEFTGSHWLPAAALTLEETWPQNPPQAKAGEPITRTLTLRAQGATVGVLPELGTDAKLDASIKHYPDQPAMSEDKLPTVGLTAQRQEKVALIPGKAGEFKLPAVEIPWWNTVTDRLEIAKIPERLLTVEASGEAATTPANPQPEAESAKESAPTQSTQPPGPQAPSTLAADLWFWLALFFGLGWLGTGLAWGFSLRQPAKPTPADAPQAHGLAASRSALKQACAQHDPAAARLALLDWAKARWPDAHPASLADVAGVVPDALAEEMRRLNRTLYGQAGRDWQGDGLWVAVEALARTEGKKAEQAASLEPLYR